MDVVLEQVISSGGGKSPATRAGYEDAERRAAKTNGGSFFAVPK